MAAAGLLEGMNADLTAGGAILDRVVADLDAAGWPTSAQAIAGQPGAGSPG